MNCFDISTVECPSNVQLTNPTKVLPEVQHEPRRNVERTQLILAPRSAHQTVQTTNVLHQGVDALTLSEIATGGAP